MRIAICFAGHLRDYVNNLHRTIIPNLIKPNADALVDVFVHTYRMRNAPSGMTWHGHNAGADVHTTHADSDLIQAAIESGTRARVRAFVIDGAAHGGERMDPGHEKMGQRWSLFRSYSLMDGWAMGWPIYDLVVQARFDVAYERPLPFSRPAPGVWYVNKCDNATRRGVDSDVFCYGDQFAYKQMMMEPIPLGLRDIACDAGFEGEKLATAIRKHRGLDVVEVDVPLSLVRPGNFLDRVN